MRSGAGALILILLMLWGGCGKRHETTEQTSHEASEIAPEGCPEIPIPSLDGVEEAVQSLIQEEAAAVEEDCNGPRLGHLGMVYHAYDFFGAAEQCYRLAEERDKDELRWPYLLGHLLANRGATDEGTARFERALEIDSSFRPAKVHLAEVLLRSNELEEAQALFQAAQQEGGISAFTLFGLARIAAALGRPQEAIPMFQKALELDPLADAIHYPLGLAYRDAGQNDLAQTHLMRRGTVKPAPDDPILAELRQFRIGARTHIIQAQFAHKAGNWEEAERLYRLAMEEDPDDVDNWVNLAIVILRQRRRDEAMELLQKAVAEDPGEIAAHYHLADIYIELGQGDKAVEHLEIAVSREPGRASLEVALAAAYRAAERFEDALTHYGKVVELNPGSPEGRLGRALCLTRLHRYAQARESLEEDISALPDQPAFQHVLARVLAAAPDDEVRDGEGALSLLEAFRNAPPNLDYLETVAMALAEAGRFDVALQWQTRASEIARQVNAEPWIQDRLAANMALYQVGQPCRQPWSDHDPIFTQRNFWGQAGAAGDN